MATIIRPHPDQWKVFEQLGLDNREWLGKVICIFSPAVQKAIRESEFDEQDAYDYFREMIANYSPIEEHGIELGPDGPLLGIQSTPEDVETLLHILQMAHDSGFGVRKKPAQEKPSYENIRIELARLGVPTDDMTIECDEDGSIQRISFHRKQNQIND